MTFFSFLTADTGESIPNIYSSRMCKTAYLLQPNGLPSIPEPGYGGHGFFGEICAYEWLGRMNAQHFGISDRHTAEEIIATDLLFDNGFAVMHQDGREQWFFEKNAPAPGLTYYHKTHTPPHIAVKQSHPDIRTLSADRAYYANLGLFLDTGIVLRRLADGGLISPCYPILPSLADVLYLNLPSFDIPSLELDGYTLAGALVSEEFKKVPVADLVTVPFPLKFSFDQHAVYESLPASATCPNGGYYWYEGMQNDSMRDLH